MSPSPICCFNGCNSIALSFGKCKMHRYRHLCSVQNCMNQAYARRLCVAHGGRRECLTPGCNGNARSRGYCCKHSERPSQQASALKIKSESPCVSYVAASATYSSASSLFPVVENDPMNTGTDLMKLIEVEAMNFVKGMDEREMNAWQNLEISVIDCFLSDLPMQTVWSL